MAVYLKTFLITTLAIFTLTACKPGVYYTFPHAGMEQQKPTHQNNAPAPKLGELTTTDI